MVWAPRLRWRSTRAFTGRALLPSGTDENVKVSKPLRPWLKEGEQQSPARQAHKQSRQAVFAAVHALHAQGLSCPEIARRTGYGRRGIAKWLTQDAPPDRRRAEPKSTSPRRFEEFLAESWKLGVRHGRLLYLDIKKLGYTGSFSHLEKLLATWRLKEKPAGKVTPAHTPLPQLPLPSPARIIDPATGHAISPVVAAALCIKPRGMLSEEQALKVDVLKEASPDFAAMRRLAMRFRSIFRSGKAGKLNGWIEAALHSGIASMQRFARVLKRDIEAVRNAIKFPWSNGQVEGQINRLKTIKRAMYGRAGPELLKARMLPVQLASGPHRK